MELRRKVKIRNSRHTIIALIGVGFAMFLGMMLLRVSWKYSQTQITRLFSPTAFVFDIQHIYSDELHKSLVAVIKEKTAQGIVDLNQDALYRSLKSSFKIIKTVSWRFCLPRALHLSVVGVTPMCTVNTDFVLGNKKRLFSRSFFEQYNLEQLPNITVNQSWFDQKIDLDVYNFITRISKERWSRFFINYVAPSRIELTPKKSRCKSLILADEQSFFDDRKIAAISNIFEDMVKRGFISKRALQVSRHMIVFDIRFSERIIVRFFDTLKRGMGS